MRLLLTMLLSIAASVTPMLAAVITGNVNDNSGEPMIEATIKLLNARDSSFVKGTTTDLDGKFRIDAVKNGKYIIQASYIGYNNAYADASVSKGADIRLSQPIVLNESSILLTEAVVTGVKTEITAREDTIEYNAASFKTQPNAVMEDLLKKLPGVEVGDDGKITAGGKEVKKILIDGKEFFSDDPQVASKNLPVDMIEKLQVVDRKSDLARMTGIDDGEEETVINLTVKKDMQNGYFGVANAGYGTDSRYAADFNVNRFWGGNQVTLLGNFNNINQLGFTDSNGQRFRRFGGNNGITTSQSLGLNFNVGRSDETFRVGGDLLYSHTDKDSRKQQERQYLFTDSTSYLSSGSRARDKGHNIRGDFRVEWKPDSFTTLQFRPKFSLNFNNSGSLDSSFTRAGDIERTLVNRSLNTGDSHGHSVEAGASLWFNHNFASHPGRSFSVVVDYSMSNVRERDLSYSWNKFFLLDDTDDVQDQFTKNHTWRNSASVRVSWTEPLGNVKNGRFLTASYRFAYRWNNADKLVYDHPVTYPEGQDPVVDRNEEIFNEDLSNRFRNDFLNQRIQIGYRQVRSTYNLDAGLTFTPSRSKSHNLIDEAKNIPTRWVWNVAPYLRYRMRFNKTRSLTVDYRGNTSEPSMTQLQPVADMSNPLRIVIGNPDLKPSFRHNMQMRFNDFNMDAQRSIMAMLSASMTTNQIVSKTTFDSTTGGQTTTYTNVNGNWDMMFFSMLSMPLRNRNWQFNAHMHGRYAQSIGFNNGQRNRSGSLSWSPSVAIAYRPEAWDIELRPFFNIQSTTNSVQKQANRDVYGYGARLNASWFAPFGLILSSDFSYHGTSGYASGYDQEQWNWNASIAYQFMRGRAATVTLRAYDLLQQVKSISRNVTANYIDDTANNTVTRYFMLTFSYRFNTFGKGRTPDSDDDMRRGPGFGPGGRGGHGGPGGGRRPF